MKLFLSFPLSCYTSQTGESLTVKDFKLIVLLLAQEVLDGEGDVVPRLHLHHPGTGLEVRVGPQEALAEDDSGGVRHHLVHRAVHCREHNHKPIVSFRRGRKEGNTKYYGQEGLS